MTFICRWVNPDSIPPNLEPGTYLIRCEGVEADQGGNVITLLNWIDPVNASTKESLHGTIGDDGTPT
jgi:hypothetical protein